MRVTAKGRDTLQCWYWFLSLQTSHSSSTESLICKPMQESSVWYSSRAQCCGFCCCLPHSVCSTLSVWYLLCYVKSHLPVLLMLIICTASHVEICNHSLIESLWRENLMHKSHIAAWLMGSGMILKPGTLQVLLGFAHWQ